MVEGYKPVRLADFRDAYPRLPLFNPYYLGVLSAIL
uniref:Uncharacterized protein n=1 Tax=Parascaris equorum TaxID=6256 RepID=A0A914RJ97_PAREQ